MPIISTPEQLQEYFGGNLGLNKRIQRCTFAPPFRCKMQTRKEVETVALAINPQEDGHQVFTYPAGADEYVLVSQDPSGSCRKFCCFSNIRANPLSKPV